MSHWTSCKIKIQNPNMELLRSALAILAKELGSKVVENFEVIGYGHSAKCPLAIPLDLPYGNGYGILIQNGEIKVVVDDHGAPMTAKEFVSRLQQVYTTLAIAQSVQELGWTISNVQESEKGVLMEVEVYG